MKVRLWGFIEDGSSEASSFAFCRRDHGPSCLQLLKKSQIVPRFEFQKSGHLPSEGVLWQWPKERLGNTS